jgi:AcrR family transcriptional regulator
MPRVTAAHEQQVKERIVAAALRVFAEKGFHRATVQDIVRESGLSVGAIYTHFKGKDEIFLAGCDASSGEGFGELGDRLARARSTIDKMIAAVGFFFDTVDADAFADVPGMSTFLVQAWAEADQEPSVREMLARRRGQIVTVAQLVLREGIAQGELPAWIDVEALAGGFSALLDGLILQRVEEGSGYRREKFERRILAVIELAIAAGCAPARPAIRPSTPVPFIPQSARRPTD